MTPPGGRRRDLPGVRRARRPGPAAISAGTSDGLAAARARGKRLGRPPALTPEQLREVRELLLRPESAVSGVARQLGVSRSTIYKYLPDAMHAGAAGPLAVELDDYAHGRASTAPAAHLAAYQARPGRGVLVIDDLADLNGPTAGTVDLPLRLFWHPNRRFTWRSRASCGGCTRSCCARRAVRTTWPVTSTPTAWSPCGRT